MPELEKMDLLKDISILDPKESYTILQEKLEAFRLRKYSLVPSDFDLHLAELLTLSYSHGFNDATTSLKPLKASDGD